MTYANSLDPDQALHCVGPDLRSKLFDLMIQFLPKNQNENVIYNNFFDKTIYHARIAHLAKGKKATLMLNFLKSCTTTNCHLLTFFFHVLGEIHLNRDMKKG